jgi:hypothetical protein
MAPLSDDEIWDGVKRLLTDLAEAFGHRRFTADEADGAVGLGWLPNVEALFETLAGEDIDGLVLRGNRRDGWQVRYCEHLRQLADAESMGSA